MEDIELAFVFCNAPAQLRVLRIYDTDTYLILVVEYHNRNNSILYCTIIVSQLRGEEMHLNLSSHCCKKPMPSSINRDVMRFFVICNDDF